MRDAVLQIINTVLANRGKKQIESLSDSMKLRDDIGFDSLDLAELTVRIEAQFKVDIFEKGIISTVGEIFDRLK
jgi:acyl carrier protein